MNLFSFIFLPQLNNCGLLVTLKVPNSLRHLQLCIDSLLHQVVLKTKGETSPFWCGLSKLLLYFTETRQCELTFQLFAMLAMHNNQFTSWLKELRSRPFVSRNVVLLIRLQDAKHCRLSKKNYIGNSFLYDFDEQHSTN